MGQIKCDYCGNFYADDIPNCPTCGAVNSAYKRTATGTPQTIEELKQWYEDHHLPPEEVTRFFIGKNVHEPKAFGIYTDGYTYFVYKNKADGTRAVRYQGTDEAYAVNELYLRLKEEILNQKGHQLTSSARSNVSTSSSMQKRKKASRKATGWIIGLCALFAIGSISEKEDSKKYHSGNYYQTEDETVYYCDYDDYGTDSYVFGWWRYDPENREWTLLYTHDETVDQFPDELMSTNEKGKTVYPEVINIIEYGDELGIPYEEYSIYHSRNYIDAGHHFTPDRSYYQVNNTLYYYLDDNYGSRYGYGDNSGWYTYDEDSESWSYLCDKDDSSSIGEELWYDPNEYRIGSTYSDVYDYASSNELNWSQANFDDSIWGEEYNQAYENYQTQRNNNSNSDSGGYSSNDYDNDYDWDYGNDDWDSGWSDWDSDW